MIVHPQKYAETRKQILEKSATMAIQRTEMAAVLNVSRKLAATGFATLAKSATMATRQRTTAAVRTASPTKSVEMELQMMMDPEAFSMKNASSHLRLFHYLLKTQRTVIVIAPARCAAMDI
jgi:hypothetical protein